MARKPTPHSPRKGQGRKKATSYTSPQDKLKRGEGRWAELMRVVLSGHVCGQTPSPVVTPATFGAPDSRWPAGTSRPLRHAGGRRTGHRPRALFPHSLIARFTYRGRRGPWTTLPRRSRGRPRGRREGSGAPGASNPLQRDRSRATPPPQSAGTDSWRHQCAWSRRARGGARAGGGGRWPGGGAGGEQEVHLRVSPAPGVGPSRAQPGGNLLGATTSRQGPGATERDGEGTKVVSLPFSQMQSSKIQF